MRRCCVPVASVDAAVICKEYIMICFPVLLFLLHCHMMIVDGSLFAQCNRLGYFLERHHVHCLMSVRGLLMSIVL